MGIQGAVDATLVWKEETTLGTLPGATSARRLRRVSSSLNGKKGSFASNEVRSDQQVSDMRHGMRSVSGGIETELAIVNGSDTLDTFLAAALRAAAWVTGVSTSPSDFATGVTIANGTGNTSTLTFAGAGNLLTKGFRLGDVVRGTGLTTGANNGRNLRITALTSTVMTVTPQITATSIQAAGWTIAVAGSKIVQGVAKRSFMIEQSYADAVVYERFMGCRIGGMGINVGPNGMATASFDFLGQDFSYNGTQYYTSPTAETVGGNVTGVDGNIRVAGTEMGVVTGLQLNINHSLSNPGVIGTTKTPEIFYGRGVVTGSVSVLLDGLTMLSAFDLETECDIVCFMDVAMAAPEDFLCFNLQRVKFSDASKTLGPDGAVLLQMPFQGLLQGGTPGTTGKDNTTLAIQRSY